jgi:hypothetical protein
MGQVVRMFHDACDCGWKTPRNVQVVLDDPPKELNVLYECPKCGMRRYVACVDRKKG